MRAGLVTAERARKSKPKRRTPAERSKLKARERAKEGGQSRLQSVSLLQLVVVLGFLVSRPGRRQHMSVERVMVADGAAEMSAYQRPQTLSGLPGITGSAKGIPCSSFRMMIVMVVVVVVR